MTPLIGGPINARIIEQQLDEILRLAVSIQQGTVTASLILRKLGSYPRQTSLAVALREIGRIERTLYTLNWLEDPALRRRVTAGLNKCEARNSLARAVFFNRLGEIRDRSFENQHHRASGQSRHRRHYAVEQRLPRTRRRVAWKDSSLQPRPASACLTLGWEHINLTGDYTCHANKRVAKGGFRSFRTTRNPSSNP